MKKFLLCLSVLGMAGCAANPSNISAQYIDPEPFMRQSCAQLAQLDQKDTQNLASAEMHQRRMHQSDAWGVALIGVPVGSAGGDRHKEIGQLKGELEAIHTVEHGKNCIGRYSPTNYDSTGTITVPPRSASDSDPTYGYRNTGTVAPSATTGYPPLQTTPTDVSTGTGTGTGTGITTGSMPAQEGLSAPGALSAPSHAPTYTAPHYVVPPAGYTAPSYSGNPFQ
ncbi:hypothetical protein ACM0P6_13985 [Komagataeibacter sucrofermentans]|uniref:Lipoprotein n=1 Tax=Komagataeibacter sucrofermentans TaxID=1053551 RepID=A0A318QP78_9PROT|nr:hypothetical protein [Komagataeibacter sucrofermentans]PYD79112.1 hypothetical protein CFR77_08370 [Komagataeibacter sucrofermentans]GBQ45491.1 hypothetical protein AA15973_0630 [Komagataeibacter sucrofermentans DSM 15973]